MDEYKQKLADFFNPEILKQNLVIASLFIAVYDNFKASIVDKVKYFYWSGFKNGKELFRDYEEKVLNKVKSEKNRQIRATLLWLKEHEAISSVDEEKFKDFTGMRNKVAHEMTRMLVDGFPENIYELYVDMITLFNKIEKWWIIEIEMSINPPNIPYEDIDWDGITSINLEFIKIMTDIAFTDNDKYLQLIKAEIEKHNG